VTDTAPARPRPWRDVSHEVAGYARPFVAVRWLIATFAFDLHRSPFLALVKLVATFAVPLGAITYCSEAKDRHRERIYRTWDVVAKAESESASPARIEALQDLVESGAPLAQIHLPQAWLESIDLRGADLRFADLSGAHLAESNLGCRLRFLIARRCANLRWSNLAGADLAWADVSRANLSRAVVLDVDFTCANLAKANLMGLRGWERATWLGADLTGATNAPKELLAAASRRSFATDAVPMTPLVRRQCAAGRPASNRAVDTLPLSVTVGPDMSALPRF
jgi:hypothetical protein